MARLRAQCFWILMREVIMKPRIVAIALAVVCFVVTGVFVTIASLQAIARARELALEQDAFDTLTTPPPPKPKLTGT